MKRLRFYIYVTAVLVATSSSATMCDNYKPEKYSSDNPVDFVYVNKSDYKINALLLDHVTYAYDTLLNNKTTINLEPGESVTIVTNNEVDGNSAIFNQYIVIFDDATFFSCMARERRSLYGRGWNDGLPMYPTSYKILSGVNERNHTVYEFTFTNEHYEVVYDDNSKKDNILINEDGKFYFKDWERYADLQNEGMGVMIDNLLWSPFDYDTKVEQLKGHFHFLIYEDAVKSCPQGWRAPTADEFAALTANHSKWGESRTEQSSRFEENSEVGYWFSGSKEYSVDVPAVYFDPHGTSDNLNQDEGIYWTSTQEPDDKMAVAFRFDKSGNIGLVQKEKSEPCLLRCVKDYNLRKYYFGD